MTSSADAKKRTIRLDGALDLRATLGAGAQSDSGSGHQIAWRTYRTPQGPATIQITTDRENVHAEAWGPGNEWALDAAPALLGLDDERDSFVAHHDLIGRLARRFPGLRIGRTGLVWDALPQVILGQKVTTAEASRSWRSLVKTYGEAAPGPGEHRLGPTPETIASLGYHDFHPHGVERKRATIIIGAARRVARLEEVVAMTTEQAYQRLMAFPGIGIWTASLVLGQALGDPDAIPIGDYHIPNTVSWALAGEPRGNDERMIELLEPYQGHRSRVIRLLHLGGIHAPKYGPRTAPRDIRGL